MDKKDAQLLMFNFYREAELRGASLLARILQRTTDPDLQIQLTRHLADETHHAWLWTERITELGGQVRRVPVNYQNQLRKRVGVPTSLLDLLALTYVVEERAGKRYREHAVRSDIDDKTRTMLQTMLKDEDWHLAWVKEKLSELAATEGREGQEGHDRCAATLARYRRHEQAVYDQLAEQEQQLLNELRIAP